MSDQAKSRESESEDDENFNDSQEESRESDDQEEDQSDNQGDDRSDKAQKRNGIKYLVPGGCEDSQEYNHSYLTCTKCKISEVDDCKLDGCPCNGTGKLILIDRKKRSWVHEIPGFAFSVRIYTNQPQKYLERVTKGLRKFKRMQKKRSSSTSSKMMTGSQENLKENNQKLKDPEFVITTDVQSTLAKDSENAAASASAESIQETDILQYPFQDDDEGYLISNKENNGNYEDIAILFSSQDDDTEHSTKKTKGDEST